MRLVQTGIAAVLFAALGLAQYKVESAGAPPAEASALSSALAKEGLKVVKADGSPLCEIWFVAAEPQGGSAEQNTTMTSVPHGALLGVVRVPARWRAERNFRCPGPCRR